VVLWAWGRFRTDEEAEVLVTLSTVNLHLFLQPTQPASDQVDILHV
jgi:hypothetical protein